MAKYTFNDKVPDGPLAGKTFKQVFDTALHDHYLLNLVLSGELEVHEYYLEEIEKGAAAVAEFEYKVTDPELYQTDNI